MSGDGFSDSHLLGDPDDLRRILEALDDRNEALDTHTRELTRNNEGVDNLSQLVATNTAEVRALRNDVLARPTAAAVAYSRRLTIVGLLVVIFVSLFAQDAHVEHCSPGSRVVTAFDHLLEHPLGPTATQAERQADFERYYDSAPAWCDVTYPQHSHAGEPWPTSWNVVGMAGYLALLGLLSGWLLVARRRVRPRKRK